MRAAPGAGSRIRLERVFAFRARSQYWRICLEPVFAHRAWSR
jgi:hypothetical protein